MLGWLRKKRTKNEHKNVQLFDLTGAPLYIGDVVWAQRYELGKSQLIIKDDKFFYRSLENQQEVIYVKMIDAITGHQKVIKDEP